MSEGAEFDVLGIGNAIVDVLAHCDDEFLDAESLVKGSMNLIEVEQPKALYTRMGPAVEVSGGAAGQLHGRRRLVRRPHRLHRQDPRRRVRGGLRPRHPRRRRPLRDAPGVDGPPPRSASSSSRRTPTARCPPTSARAWSSARRTSTWRWWRGRRDVPEGYLWDKPRAKEAFRVAMAAPARAGRRVSLTLSDSFCVERHLDEFRALVENDVDVLFANEEEILALYADPRPGARRLGRPRPLGDRGDHPLRARLDGRDGRRHLSRCPPRPSSSSSTRPAPATSTPPGSCTASPPAGRWRSARRSGRSPRPR